MTNAPNFVIFVSLVVKSIPLLSAIKTGVCHTPLQIRFFYAPFAPFAVTFPNPNFFLLCAPLCPLWLFSSPFRCGFAARVNLGESPSAI